MSEPNAPGAESADDPWAKGSYYFHSYTVVGGIHMLYAVMPKIHYATDLGDPFGPPERVPVSGCDPDLDQE